MVLTIIFDKTCEHVLMCFHSKQYMYNYVGGHIKPSEDPVEASYRELYEETGITKDDVNLAFVRRESVTCNSRYYPQPCWNMTVMAGVLNKDVELKPEKNDLMWVDITDTNTLVLATFGNGNCYTYMKEALSILNLE